MNYIGYIVVILTVMFPFAVAVLPVIPYIMTENGHWMWGMILTFPLCVTMFQWITEDGLEKIMDYFFKYDD